MPDPTDTETLAWTRQWLLSAPDDFDRGEFMDHIEALIAARIVQARAGDADACRSGCRMAAMEALIDRERPTLEAIEAMGPAPKPDGEWTRPQYESYIADLRAKLSHVEAQRDDLARVGEGALREAWDRGYEAATYMARCWGHTDHWEDEPDNPYRAALADPDGDPACLPEHVMPLAQRLAARIVQARAGEAVIDAAHIEHQREWSTATFGPRDLRGPTGPLAHIRKELDEVAEDPTDLEEWVDVLILAFDGAWRAGHEPQQIIEAVKAKQAKNEARDWPDWRGVPADQAIEHVRPEARAGEGALRERVEAALAFTGDERGGVSCGGFTVDADGCYASDLAARVRAALAETDRP